MSRDRLRRYPDNIEERFLKSPGEKSEIAEGVIVERARDIFYDTDNIRERQHEKIRSCGCCAGVLSTVSTSSLGQHILAVQIPKWACGPCREQGMAWFREGSDGAYTHLYLQDRDNGIFERI